MFFVVTDMVINFIDIRITRQKNKVKAYASLFSGKPVVHDLMGDGYGNTATLSAFLK